MTATIPWSKENLPKKLFINNEVCTMYRVFLVKNTYMRIHVVHVFRS